MAVLVVGCASEEIATAPPPPASGICAGITNVSQGNPPASLPLTSDPTLEAEFPKQVDGQSVTQLASARLVETLCALGGELSVNATRANLPSGYDLSQITVASAQVSVDNVPETITAYRMPGATGAQLLSLAGFLSASLSPEAPRFTSDLVPVTLGGKNAMAWTDATNGATTYLYTSGDTLFLVDGAVELQAGKVLAALP